jgi:1,4-alpha-glucan branching enzyme
MAADLALILHAHLPYVRSREPEILEERWFYEAVAESYLPLIWALERLEADRVPARLALSLSGPVLCMLGDRTVMAACRERLGRVRALAEREAGRLRGSPLGPAAEYHRRHYTALVDDLESCGLQLLPRLGRLEQAGLLELLTTAGTHPCLPLLATNEARFAHIEAATAKFAACFGHRPAGLWLPECAYAPGLEHLLAAAGIRWFVTEGAAVAGSYPPVDGPVLLTPGGVAAFARDTVATRQVWDSKAGYPGDPAYREFYRDAGYDLPEAEVAPWLVDGRVRSDTGLKFYRVTGADTAVGQKLPYDPGAAVAQVRVHARHFAGHLRQQSGLVVAPFDAELFGHWWFEGPAWLEALFRELGEVRPVTPGDWLREHGAQLPVARLPATTWGAGGDYRVWLSAANDWIYPELHAAEGRMRELAARPDTAPVRLNQAARELMLAQASDWPFILYGQTAVEYAGREVRRHLAWFGELADGTADPDQFLPEDGIFPELDARALWNRRRKVPAAGPLRILMLSWEFPPNNVGGLGRHVHDLGAALVRAGHTVQVVTLADEGAGATCDRAAGMTVHRVARPPAAGNFLVWAYRANQAMVGVALAIPARFDLVHSHDWLAGQAGMALQARWGTALIATIHATEKGRTGQIREPIQQAIHEEEWLLTAAADRVITVSRAMAEEVADSFRVAPAVIYNGVEPSGPAGAVPVPLDAPYFCYIGRLVAEKGVQVAIRALAELRRPACLVVAGQGPMEAELRVLARNLGLEGRVHFAGRVSDSVKSAWLQHAVAGLVPSLYEPFGIVALEVMAAGRPLIVADAGGLSEIVTTGVNGWKVPPADVPALAEAMEQVLAGREPVARLAEAGRADALRRFSWEAIAVQTVQVYRG